VGGWGGGGGGGGGWGGGGGGGGGGGVGGGGGGGGGGGKRRPRVILKFKSQAFRWLLANWVTLDIAVLLSNVARLCTLPDCVQ
jgi:hypothetical protein